MIEEDFLFLLVSNLYLGITCLGVKNSVKTVPQIKVFSFESVETTAFSLHKLNYLHNNPVFIPFSLPAR